MMEMCLVGKSKNSLIRFLVFPPMLTIIICNLIVNISVDGLKN